ncbi:hypothetical protein FQN54_000770 [Arachnomyces sp. PD_36]|nr:hypothetical protein FQN54_000770 [Arachnomyces sp. PD_36]
MAQKASKTLAARNTTVLLRTHLITLALHILLTLSYYLFNRQRSILTYFLLTTPSLTIEFFLERLGRPTYNSADGSMRSPGKDLAEKGLTEYMWDVLYWTWGCMGAVCVFGDRAWWLWVAVPVYSIWLAVSTFRGMTGGGGFPGMGGGAGAGDGEGDGGYAESKRQKKLEKRGQRVQYR